MSKDELYALGMSDWRTAMPIIRRLAWTYRSEGRCEVLQKGTVLPDDVDIDDVQGPIRIRRCETGPAEPQ